MPQGVQVQVLFRAPEEPSNKKSSLFFVGGDDGAVAGEAGVAPKQKSSLFCFSQKRGE